MKQKYLMIYSLIFVGFLGCKSERENLSQIYKGIEDLTTYTVPTNLEYDITFERQITIENSETLELGILGSFSVDNSGRVYINDSDRQTLLVFESDGNFITEVGRKGNGPGEFMSGPFPFIVSDKLYALDAMPMRLSIFSTDSFELIRTLDLNPVNKSSIEEIEDTHVRQILHLKEDIFLVSFVSFYREPPTVPGQKIDGSSIFYYLMDEDAQIISDQIFKLEQEPFLTGTVNGTVHLASNFQIFSRPLVAVGSDGHIFTGMSETFTIKKFTPNGDYISSFYYPIRNITLNREEALQVQISEFLREILSQNTLPESWPILNDLLTDDENRLWISTITDNFDVYEWWVLEETGELISKFEWPRDEPIEVVKNGYMYTRETDEETDLQQIVKYRIELTES